MAENGTMAEKKLAKLSRAVNRRASALQKIRDGRPSVVDERHLRKLVKQAQRRKTKLAKDIERHSVKKAATGAEAATEAATEA